MKISTTKEFIKCREIREIIAHAIEAINKRNEINEHQYGMCLFISISIIFYVRLFD